MNIYEHFEHALTAAVTALIAEGALPQGLAIPRLVLEPAREAAHGDLASNAAMLLAKPAGKKPKELAEAIAAKLATVEGVAKTEVAGPGFINLTLDPAFWTKVVGAVVREELACEARPTLRALTFTRAMVDDHGVEPLGRAVEACGAALASVTGEWLRSWSGSASVGR